MGKHKFHLPPNEEIKYTDKEGKTYSISGLRKSKKRKVIGDNWVDDGFQVNEEGKFWWEDADLIAIVRADKRQICDKCGSIIKASQHTESWSNKRMRLISKLISRNYYVGISAFSCNVPYWGYDTKFCLTCALEIFNNAQVYSCDWANEPSSCWSKDIPLLDTPLFSLLDEIKKVG